jgi:hypothetical protein
MFRGKLQVGVLVLPHQYNIIMPEATAVNERANNKSLVTGCTYAEL